MRPPPAWRRAVRELDGGKGLFKDFRVIQTRSLLRTTTKFSGKVDLHRGIESFSDADLESTLGSPLGATPDEFAKRIGAELQTALPITVGVILPGKVESNAPTESADSAAWHPKLGDELLLAATAQKWNAPVIVFGSIAVVAAAAALLFGLRSGAGSRPRTSGRTPPP